MDRRIGRRWGLGKRQRSAFGLADFPQNTFGTALDRVLLGVTADGTDSEWLALAMPLDDVESNDIDLAGRFAEYIDRLDKALWVLRRPQNAGQWAAALTHALDLLVDVPAADAWQRAQAHREIGAAVEHSGDAELRLPDVRAMLAGQLAGRPTRANFRTGELTVCTMVPMRSVPHRVVVLLGLDDDVFPRSAHIDGDDVLTQNPRVGERDPRSEDRQLLLDAIMSAGEKVLLFYTGADPVTGAARPPAIPLSEVRDVVATMIGVAGGDVNPVVRHHPLQPFDARNFLPDAPFSFDETALAGACAAQDPATEDVPAVLAHLLLTPPEKQVDIDLADLVAYLVHPAQGFLRQRLGIRIPELDEGTTDALDIDLDPLARWNLGDRMLEYRLAGVSAADFRAAEWRRGTLPPYALGESALDDVTYAVESLVSACAPVHSGRSTTIDTMVDLGDGRRLTGTVGGVHGHVIARSVFSKLSAKHRITAWVHLLAVAASGHDGRWQAVTTGRGRGRMPAWRSTMVAPEDPHDLLLQLVDLRDRGLGAVLPVTTGAPRHMQNSAPAAAPSTWHSTPQETSSEESSATGRTGTCSTCTAAASGSAISPPANHSPTNAPGSTTPLGSVCCHAGCGNHCWQPKLRASVMGRNVVSDDAVREGGAGSAATGFDLLGTLPKHDGARGVGRDRQDLRDRRTRDPLRRRRHHRPVPTTARHVQPGSHPGTP